MRRARLTIAFAAAVLFAGCSPEGAGPPAVPPVPAGPPIEERIDALLAQMTYAEKVSQLLDNAGAVERLGIPAYGWWNEALHGVARAGVATVFPQAIGLAATWDEPLLQEVATVISDEARAKHHEALRNGVRARYHGLTFWSPNINIFRDPRWGRGQETYGEDPYLTSRMAIRFVKGLQGDDPKYRKTDATLKHFAVHSGPERLRHRFDANCSDRDLRETYLYAFERAVKEAKPAAVMGAYNRFRGEACCASELLLGVLRDEWGFGGYVVSDCDAVWDIFASHRLVPGPVEASTLALARGCDLDCGLTYLWLLTAEPQGLVTGEDVDRALRRLFRTRFELGMFDPPEEVPYARIPIEDNDSEPHRQLNLRTARESLVLLQNDGVLPLERGGLKKIAVFGPSAHDLDVLVGNYNGTPSRPVTLLDGIRNEAGPGVQVVHDRGCDYVGSGGSFAPALSKLEGADVAVVCVGLTPKLEGEENLLRPPADGFDLGDRTRIELPEAQKAFVRAVRETGVPLVLVLTGGGALAIPEEEAAANAVLDCWYPGGEGGAAVADVVFGDYNPAGRLPVTFYRSTADLPDFERYDMAGRTYKYFAGEALHEFGYGISYTSFAYSGLTLSRRSVHSQEETLRVSLRVKNTGSRGGEEVVQVYLRHLDSERPMPLKRLVGFRRLQVPSGKSASAEIEISARDFASYDEDRAAFVLEPGDFEVQVGASSRDIRLKGVVTCR